MEAITSWIVGILMLALPAGWTQTSTKCEEVSVIHGAADQKTEECTAQWTKGEAQLTVFIWTPVVARDGRLPVDRLLSGTIDLKDINAGFDRLAAGEVVRLVVRP